MIADQSAAIIVAPFAAIDRPALGPHLLQAIARKRGHNIRILYANIMFATTLGIREYRSIVGAPPLELTGERCLAPFAYPTAFRNELAVERAINRVLAKVAPGLSARDFARALDRMTQAVIGCLLPRVRTIGFSSTFEQINSTIILSRAVHQHDPTLLQIVGGANCEGQMAVGQAALLPYVKHVFAGESDETFLAFMEDPSAFKDRIVRGQPKASLEDSPCPDFSDYFHDLETYLGDRTIDVSLRVRLPYESSRGCWWGVKHHCTFCGLNGEGMQFRSKTPEKVISELSRLARTYQVSRFFMTDNIMPHSYFRSLLPKLNDHTEKFEIFYEQKANLDLAKVVALSRAGITAIQPGIESLSSCILRLMRKGVTASQNIRTLRYCRSVGIEVAWNMLYGFPGEEEKWYEEMCGIIPKLSHLYPPSGVSDLSIDRFSPYFDNPQEYGIRDLRPHQSYSDAILEDIDLADVAYHFVGDMRNTLSKETVAYKKLSELISCWRALWNLDRPPVLSICQIGDEFLLVDTRQYRSEVGREERGSR